MNELQKNITVIANDVARAQNKGVKVEVNEKGGVRITNLQAVGDGVANEYYSLLINLLKSQAYKDGVDRNAFLVDINPFRDTREWENGQIQITSKDLKVPEDGYSKVLEFDAIYNPADRTIAVAYGQDTFKKSVSEKIDVKIAKRAINDQGAMQFLTNMQDKQNDDLAKQLYDDFVPFFKIAAASFYAAEVDTSTATDSTEANKLKVKAEKDAVDYLKRPNTIYNELGFVYAERPEIIVLVRDAISNNEIEVELNANAFNNDYLKTEAVKIAEMLLEPETTSIYSVVMDQRKVAWQITEYSSIVQNLDGWQTRYASRMWYGMYSVPWLGGIVILEAATVTPTPTATIANTVTTDPTTPAGTDGIVGADITITDFTGQGTAVLNPAGTTTPVNLVNGANAGITFEDLTAGTYTIEVYDDTTLVASSDDLVLEDPA